MLIESARRSGNGLRIGLFGLAAGCLIAFWVWSVTDASGGGKQGRMISPGGFSFIAGPPSVLAGYERALRLIEAKRDREAIALLADLRQRPLETQATDALSDRTPSALMIRLCMVQCDRARETARSGDALAAHRWLRSARALATTVLAAPEATLDTIRTAHTIDVTVGRIALEVEKSVRSPAAAASRVARRETRLHAYFQETLWPQIREARRQRDAAEQFADLSAPPGGAREQARRRVERARDAWDANLAASLREQYVAARAVLLSDDARNA